MTQKELMQHLKALLLDLQEYTETIAYLQAQQHDEDKDDLPHVNIMLNRLNQIAQTLKQQSQYADLVASLDNINAQFNQPPETHGVTELTTIQNAKAIKAWNLQLLQQAVAQTH
jgi:hypothetical protein